MFRHRLYWRCGSCDLIHTGEFWELADVQEWSASPEARDAVWVTAEPAFEPEPPTLVLQ